MTDTDTSTRAGSIRILVIGDQLESGPDRVGTELACNVLLGNPPDGAGLEPDRVVMVDAADRSVADLVAVIELLRPTVVLAEGGSADGPTDPAGSVSSRVGSALGVSVPKAMSLTAVERPWGTVAFVTAVRPAFNWSTTRHPRWRILERILVDARQIALLG